MLKKLIEKLREKFPGTTCGYSMVLEKLPVSTMLSLNFYKLGASPVEGQSLQQKQKKRRKRKGENKI